MDFSGVNYLAIAAAVVAGMISGALWYGLLAKQWMSAAGLSEEEVNQTAGIYIVAFIAQIVIAWMLAGLIGHLGTFSATAGMISWNRFLMSSRTSPSRVRTVP